MTHVHSGRRLAPLILMLGLLAPLPALAQSPIQFGVQGGLNFNSLGGADAEGTDMTTGWQLGVPILLGRGAFSVLSGALVTRKGAAQAGQGVSSTLKLTYLQVPLLARIRLSDAGATGSIGGFFYGGPALGVEVGCSVSAVGGTFSASGSCDEANGGDPDVARFGRSDLTAILGFGAETGAVMVAVQYELGLSKISENAEIKTRAVSAVARYFFGRRAPRPSLMSGTR